MDFCLVIRLMGFEKKQKRIFHGILSGKGPPNCQNASASHSFALIIWYTPWLVWGPGAFFFRVQLGVSTSYRFFIIILRVNWKKTKTGSRPCTLPCAEAEMGEFGLENWHLFGWNFRWGLSESRVIISWQFSKNFGLQLPKKKTPLKTAMTSWWNFVFLHPSLEVFLPPNHLQGGLSRMHHLWVFRWILHATELPRWTPPPPNRLFLGSRNPPPKWWPSISQQSWSVGEITDLSSHQGCWLVANKGL